jgi:3-hydroxy acid dehydrogenase / malonic semialdehyde reductase
MANYIPKIVLITGATSDFGRVFAQRFAALGCKLVLTGRDQEKLQQVATKLLVPVHQIVLDLADRQAITAAMKALPAEFAAVDLLINNAGGALGQEPAQNSLLDDWLAMIDVNVSALAIMTHAVLAGMAQRKSGHIINIGSIAGSYPYPGGNVYCAVKAFTQQFSLALRADLISTNVRITNIEPGMAQTDFSLKRFKGDVARAAKVYEGANPLTAEDVADAVVWAATLSPRVNINRIELMPTTQAAGPLAVHRAS